MGMDAGDVCIFVAGYCFATEASQKPPVSHGLARGPGTLGHGHARRPDVNFVHEGGREGAAGPVAGHGQGWLGTATALHTRSLVMTDYDYDQCTMYVFCPRARGAGRISRPIPAGGVWTRQRQPQTCQDSFLGKMGHSRGGGGELLVVGFLQSGGLHSRFLSYFPDAQRERQRGGASASRIPLLRTGTTLRRNKGNKDAFPIQEPRKQPDGWGARTKRQFRRGQRPSMPASYLPSARQVLRIRVLSIWYQVVLQRQAFFPARHKKNKIPRARNGKLPKTPASLCEKVASKRRRRGL